MEKVIFSKKYDSESLCDIERDVIESFSCDFNPDVVDIPVDEHGFQEGTFEVTVTWRSE